MEAFINGAFEIKKIASCIIEDPPLIATKCHHEKYKKLRDKYKKLPWVIIYDPFGSIGSKEERE